MDENRRLLPFPQPPASAPATIPVFGVASNCLTTLDPVQGSGWPSRNPGPWVPPTPLPSTPNEALLLPHLSVFPHASQPLPASPAFPTPQGRLTHGPTTPTTHLGLSQPRRSITMPVPVLRNDTQATSVFYPSYALQAPIMAHTQLHSEMSGETQIPVDCQRNQGDPYYKKDEDKHGISTMHDDGALEKGLLDSDRPLTGIQKIFRRKKRPNRMQTLATNPISGTTSYCRLPECGKEITGEVAERLGGFCGHSHMETGICDRIATLCPGCNRRACPEGQEFCSECTEGQS
ncbi:hypothetical protein H4582DRAFT_1045212 [Lactarius indigo]|nr:hypothetical protein H4582DRAFT_1045212 [Lactarius indigo]